MKRSCILVLCLLACLLGESIASTVKLKHHHASPSSQSELLQTQSRSTTETETLSQTSTETATETSCDPDCVFNYPYTEGGCKTPPPESSDTTDTTDFELITHEGEGGEPIPPIVIVTTEEEATIYFTGETTYGSFNEEVVFGPTIEEEHDLYEGTYETGEGSTNEEVTFIPTVEEEHDLYEGTYETGEGSTNEEIVLTPEEEPPVFGEEGSIYINYEGEGPSEPIPPPPVIVITEEEETIYFTGETTYGSFNEEVSFTPTVDEEHDLYDEGTYESTEGSFNEEVVFGPTIEETQDTFDSGYIEEKDECTYTASITSGVTHAYGQPTTYFTYILHDNKYDQDVTYTYVLTTMYQGTVKKGEADYVVYGTGAINFYNTYYGVNDYLTDKPGCSCVCGYSSYTFSYSFDF